MERRILLVLGISTTLLKLGSVTCTDISLSNDASNGILYPEYCSKQVELHQIPALSEKNQDALNLVQVQVLIRHGGRTTWTSKPCWDDYEPKWDCDAVNIMIPILEDEEDATPTLLFRKVFDSGENYLGGTCTIGGLLNEGYRQEMENGRLLRQAYLGPNGLFNTFNLAEVPSERVYFQSDDEQRTLMSGQVLTTSLFNETADGTIVDWHTMDYNADQMMDVKESECPILQTYHEDAMQSEEFQIYNSSQAVKQLVQDVEQVFGSSAQLEFSLFDCVMANLCADKELPSGVTNDLVHRIIDHRVKRAAAILNFEESIYPKTGIQQLIRKMKERIKQVQNGEDHLSFVLYSAHDTTVMNTLAALGLWDQKWAPYASMIALELYQEKEIPENYFYRIIYNGKELRHKGCSSGDNEPCPLSLLMNSMAFTQEELSCAADDVVFESQDIFMKGLDPRIWIGVSLFCLILGMIVGVVVSIIFGWTKSRDNSRYLNLDEKGEEKEGAASEREEGGLSINNHQPSDVTPASKPNSLDTQSTEGIWATAVVDIEEQTGNVI